MGELGLIYGLLQVEISFALFLINFSGFMVLLSEWHVPNVQVAVLVEMLPLSGVPLGSSVAGVSVLPAELISTKPRLCVKSLASDAKATKK